MNVVGGFCVVFSPLPALQFYLLEFSYSLRDTVKKLDCWYLEVSSGKALPSQLGSENMKFGRIPRFISQKCH